MMPLELHQAKRIAAHVVADLEPFCTRIEIAGSIRRGKPKVKDIEVLCIPKIITASDLMGNVVASDCALMNYLRNQLGAGTWEKRVGASGSTSFGLNNKWLRFNGAPVDVFTTSERLWGWHQFIRTGPADWNIRAMSQLHKFSRFGHISTGIYDQELGKYLDLPDEMDVFAALESKYVPPEKRR